MPEDIARMIPNPRYQASSFKLEGASGQSRERCLRDVSNKRSEENGKMMSELFKKDIRFNHLLSEFSTTIRKNSTTSHNGTQCTKNNPNVPDSDTLMTKIFSYVHVDETIFKSAP
ncbi:hypothetical protein EG328_004793 [Venturia inaequalis]|uniref:Uncharacterized protein n=1 Tax=Venturia inaequalis TaxID=5025 RepID=A0A8H3VF35_VENIN|nr:hypothetical protein EG328_004793 [Venturia inaequalis]